MIRYDALDALPVRQALPGLHDALEGHGTAVLVAPPGTGKPSRARATRTERLLRTREKRGCGRSTT
ncbi:hypothetical protein ACWC2H_01550, partial [Streptomyces sp. 900105755]